ncbi:bifunctional (p)ppGpp synthetase/guanosine-3',5'-bis(diphosphate) 3'-pyrophosphohydrolase [archaeon]|nr:bifunctional (p)ppGpp synthetase/guanosine-3',5'-bis(diphosphate) 3'-pyrophosphohydrolase [archaeon]
MQIKIVLKKIESYNKDADFDLVKKAYLFAKKHHGSQKRRSGELFIQHPLNVAYILAEHRLGPTTIAAALLHDVIEDTDVDKKEIVNEFGQEIANIIDGVTKITKLRKMSFEEYKAETVRKVILASTKDLRVIFIKLADKLHNMRTVGCFRQEKCERIAREVLDVYAPIAYKLGIASIKWELEDLAFKYLEPEIYRDLNKKLRKSQKQRDVEVVHIEEVLKKEMNDHKIKSRISGRSKHLYSIYKKMLRKDKPFSDIYDIVGLRIITESVKDCYEIMGIIHGLWTPVPKEFDDYIAMPKSNMYQSLHIVVIGPDKKPVEIQIRTKDMHRVAEDGVAAHWRYKGVHGDDKFDKKLSWMKQVMEWQQESKDAKEFMEMLHIDFFESEIFTFTPRGRVIELPKGATILDFAYAVHSDVGDKTIAAKVNGHFVPVRTMLKNGDKVEIITAKNQHPSRSWLKIARTSRAQSRIKKHLRSIQDIPVKTIRSDQSVKKELEAWIIEVDGILNPEIIVAKCCSPLPGEDITGYATSNGKVTIHKKKCGTLKKIKVGSRKKEAKVRWTNKIGSVVEIKVEAVNRTGLFAEILNTLVSLNTQIKSTSAHAIGKESVECTFAMETTGIEHLQDIIKRIKRIKDVKKVYVGNLVH